MKKIRCAIYTRKSSEEGLEQEFNSLDAQREACASYIASQKHEGWVMLPEHYDDGGISGGTLERAGLQKLLADVDEGLVDQIVVYKIDRLTRSLADFAKLVERLDAANASFVSVTQSFNTATSMGRLTLNVLLSFAQFEREVTAERIRDKIAASKKKGLWMGGTVPLGYGPDGRTLKIIEEEAETVRIIYDLFEEHGSITETTKAVEKVDLRTKQRKEGQGGKPIGRGHIHAILINPLYAGRIRHYDKVHDGQHPAIIDPERWDAVQEKLISKARRARGKGGTRSTLSLLAGKLIDETGDRLTATHTNKQGKRHRYYVSSRLVDPIRKEESKARPGGWRLPAAKLESQIEAVVLYPLQEGHAGKLLVDASIDDINRLQQMLKQLEAETHAARNRILLDCIDQVTVTPGKINIEMDRDAIADRFSLDPTILNDDALRFHAPFQHRKRGVETKLVVGDQCQPELDPVLIRSIAKAHHYYDAIKKGQTFEEIAASENLSKRRILQVIDLAFLAPDILKSILQGTQPLALTAKWLGKYPLPSDWQTQREIIAKL